MNSNRKRKHCDVQAALFVGQASPPVFYLLLIPIPFAFPSVS